MIHYPRQRVSCVKTFVDSTRSDTRFTNPMVSLYTTMVSLYTVCPRMEIYGSRILPMAVRLPFYVTSLSLRYSYTQGAWSLLLPPSKGLSLTGNPYERSPSPLIRPFCFPRHYGRRVEVGLNVSHCTVPG